MKEFEIIVNERIIEAINYVLTSNRCLNKASLAELFGIKPAKFSEILNKRMAAGMDIIQKLCADYDISPNWIITGQGEMLKTSIPIAKQTSNPNEGIPLIPVEAMAGALTCDTTVLEYECDRYVVPMFKGADFLIPVKGSSMYPKYSSGDIVACQRVDMNNLFFQWNKVYVIDTNQGALIKRIKPGHDENHILIVSDNEKYDPFELPYSAIHAVALVIGVIRLE